MGNDHTPSSRGAELAGSGAWNGIPFWLQRRSATAVFARPCRNQSHLPLPFGQSLGEFSLAIHEGSTSLSSRFFLKGHQQHPESSFPKSRSKNPYAPDVQFEITEIRAEELLVALALGPQGAGSGKRAEGCDKPGSLRKLRHFRSKSFVVSSVFHVCKHGGACQRVCLKSVEHFSISICLFGWVPLSQHL